MDYLFKAKLRDLAFLFCAGIGAFVWGLTNFPTGLGVMFILLAIGQASDLILAEYKKRGSGTKRNIFESDGRDGTNGPPNQQQPTEGFAGSSSDNPESGSGTRPE